MLADMFGMDWNEDLVVRVWMVRLRKEGKWEATRTLSISGTVGSNAFNLANGEGKTCLLYLILFHVTDAMTQ